MKIAVLRETTDGERRVAATPETVKKLIGLGAHGVQGLGVEFLARAWAELGLSRSDFHERLELLIREFILAEVGEDHSASAIAADSCTNFRSETVSNPFECA